MSNIAKINLSPNLLPEERDMVFCRQGKKFSELEDQEILEEVFKAIMKVYFICGQEPDKELVKAESKEITYGDIKYFKTLTVDEMNYCFRMGAAGLLGEYFGLNIRTYFKWLHAFLQLPARIEANKKQAKYIDEISKPPELTPEEKEKIIYDGVLASFAEYKKTKFIYDLGGVNYQWLLKRGLIPFTKERKLAIRDEAMALVKKNLIEKMQYESKKISGTDLQAVAQEQKVKSIREELFSLLPSSDSVKDEARRLAINLFFKELVETDTELSDYINEKTEAQ